MARYQEGEYACIIQEQGFDRSQGKGTPFFWMTFHPVKHLASGDEVKEPTVEQVKLYLTEATIEFQTDYLKKLGWDGESMEDLEPGGKCAFKGKNAVFRNSHNVDEESGKRWDNWETAINRVAVHQKGLASQLNAMFGKGGGQQPPHEPAAVAESDDIPF